VSGRKLYKCRVCGGEIKGIPKRVGPVKRERHEHWAKQDCIRQLKRALADTREELRAYQRIATEGV